jgi:hypothetical protein
MRVCILGNSHVAALRAAWALDPGRWPDLSPGFVAAPRSLLQHTAVQDGHLVATSPKTQAALHRLSGCTTVDLGVPDAFVIVGLAVAMTVALQPYRDARWFGLPSVAAVDDPGTLPQGLISARAALAIVRANLTQRLGMQLAGRLHAATRQPIFVVPQPRISDSILARRNPATRLHKIAIRNQDGAALAALFEQAATAALAPCGALFLPQPALTVSQDLLTAACYMSQPEHLLLRPPNDDDITHANAQYGALVLDQIANAVASTPTIVTQASAISGRA